jgi:hypothetical protein
MFKNSEYQIIYIYICKNYSFNYGNYRKIELNKTIRLYEGHNSLYCLCKKQLKPIKI